MEWIPSTGKLTFARKLTSFFRISVYSLLLPSLIARRSSCRRRLYSAFRTWALSALSITFHGFEGDKLTECVWKVQALHRLWTSFSFCFQSVSLCSSTLALFNLQTIDTTLTPCILSKIVWGRTCGTSNLEWRRKTDAWGVNHIFKSKPHQWEQTWQCSP